MSLVEQSVAVTLIGGGRVTRKVLRQARGLAKPVIAADGGANMALRCGLDPLAVIGDFDSIDDRVRAQIPPERLHPISEQNSTDFDKCVRNIVAPLIVGVGFSGNRIDHQLAAYNVLVRYPGKRCLLLGTHEMVFLAPPSIALDLPAGTPVSLFPMGAVEGVSDGLEWPIGGLNFTPDGQIGTSNRTSPRMGGGVSLSFTAPKMLVILPSEHFRVCAQALIDTPARWKGGA